MDTCNDRRRTGKRPYLKHEERFTIQKLLQKKTTVSKIAEILGRCERTIYREKKRGAVRHLKSDLTEALGYNADFAQDRAYENGTAKGPAEKIGGNSKQLMFMADMPKGDKWSPDALIMHLDRHGWPGFCTPCAPRRCTAISTKAIWMAMASPSRTCPPRDCGISRANRDTPGHRPIRVLSAGG
jgi:IS30 family transposase